VGHQRKGLFLALLGVVIFAATLPVTKITLSGAGMSPTFVWAGRAAVAGVLSGVYLWLSGARWPGRKIALPLLGVVMGVVIAWPLMSSWALRYTDASHLAVLNGVLPLVTAALGALLLKDAQPVRFWVCAFLGSATVSVYAYTRADGGLLIGDALMALAVLIGAVGYVGGVAAARYCSGPQAISWGLVLALPITLPISFLTFDPASVSNPLAPWIGLLYLSVMSQWVGFFFWYEGLRIGGVAKASQVQLLQLFFTLGFAALLLGEAIDASMGFAALATVLLIALGRRTSRA
jgi:drug/metabolite transporter (DMT)-like permease